MRDCAVCKGTIEGKGYKLSTSTICISCKNKDYLSAEGVGEILEIHATCISLYKSQNKTALVPPSDAIRGKVNPLWMRSTVEDFKNNLPPADRTKISILSELGLKRPEIAKELGVDVFYVNKVCRKYHIRNNLVNAQHMRVVARKSSGEHGRSQYKRANNLLNASISNVRACRVNL